jgi:hypothetical protein
MSNNVTGDQVRTWREQGLSATVHLACEQCRAPGVYTDEPKIQMDWPGCYVEPGDPRVGQSVGDRCPNCRASRSPSLIKLLGEIWRKRFT